MSERAETWTIHAESHFYRCLFACGCEFLTRGEFDQLDDVLGLRMNLKCILHKARQIALFNLDVDGYWRVLTWNSDSTANDWIPHPIPVSHGLHPDDELYAAAHRAWLEAKTAREKKP